MLSEVVANAAYIMLAGFVVSGCLIAAFGRPGRSGAARRGLPNRR